MTQNAEELLHILKTPPPVFTATQSLDILKQRYGLEGKLKPIASERDQNFLVVTTGGEKRLLKFSNTSEAPEVTSFQTSAFLHVEANDPKMVVSRVLPSLDRETEVTATGPDGNNSIVRLFSWVEGEAMISIPAEGRPDNAQKLGGWLARMAMALKDFTHPGMENGLLYDVRLVDNLEPLLVHVDDGGLYAFVAAQMERFKNSVKPALEKLPFQVIFNDMSPRNYIINPDNPAEFRGFIDFGDIAYTARIVDLAVACNYLIDEIADPLAKVASFLTGYHEQYPLYLEELALLKDVMLCRAMIQVLIYHWRAGMFPDNRDYIMQNLPQLRRTIEILSSQDHQQVLECFLQACDMEAA